MSCKPRRLNVSHPDTLNATVISRPASNLQECVPHSSLQFSALPTPDTWSKVFKVRWQPRKHRGAFCTQFPGKRIKHITDHLAGAPGNTLSADQWVGGCVVSEDYPLFFSTRSAPFSHLCCYMTCMGVGGCGGRERGGSLNSEQM